MIRTFILWVLSYTRRYENFREQQWKNYGSVTTWSYPGAPSRSGSPVGAKASGQWSLEAAYSPRRIQRPFPPASAWNACRCPTHPPQGTSLRPSQCPLAGTCSIRPQLGVFLAKLGGNLRKGLCRGDADRDREIRLASASKSIPLCRTSSFTRSSFSRKSSAGEGNPALTVPRRASKDALSCIG